MIENLVLDPALWSVCVHLERSDFQTSRVSWDGVGHFSMFFTHIRLVHAWREIVIYSRGGVIYRRGIVIYSKGRCVGVIYSRGRVL